MNEQNVMDPLSPASARPLKNRKSLGIFLVVWPILGIALILILYPLSFFIIRGMGGNREVILALVNVALGLIGIACLLGLPISIPIGIYFLGRSGNERFNIGEVIKAGWKIFKQHVGLFIFLCLLTGIISVIIDSLNKMQEKSPEISVKWVYALILFALTILSFVIKLGWVNITLKLADGSRAKIGDAFPISKRLVSFVVANILYILIVLAGTLLLVIPGIIWSIKYQFFPYLTLEGYGPVEALKKSAEITQGSKLYLMVLNIVLGLINILGAIALLVGLIITIPVTKIAMALVYRKLYPAQTIVPPEPLSFPQQLG